MFETNLKLCVICCKSMPNNLETSGPKTFPGSEGLPAFNELLHIYFIARKLLKLPGERCLQILTSIIGSGPGQQHTSQFHRFKLCENCECIVSKALGCHSKILSLQREINVLGDTLLKLVNRNIVNDVADDVFHRIRYLICADFTLPDAADVEIQFIKVEFESTSDNHDRTGCPASIDLENSILEPPPANDPYEPTEEKVLSKSASRKRLRSQKSNALSLTRSRKNKKLKLKDHKMRSQKITSLIELAGGIFDTDDEAVIVKQDALDDDGCPPEDEEDSIADEGDAVEKLTKPYGDSDGNNYHSHTNQSTKRKSLGETKTYICEECNTTYKTSRGYGRHKAAHNKSITLNHKFDCETCGFPASCESQLHHHIRKSHRGTAKRSCIICGYQCNLPSQLRSHMEVHKRYDKLIDPATGLYQCPLCTYRGNMTGFIAHKSRKHVDVKLNLDTDNHLCNQCGLSFTTAAILKGHIKTKHENRFRYSCKICGKGFETNRDLNIHMDTHNNDRVREFICNCCGMAYSRKKTLNFHLAKYHPDQLDKPYSSVLAKKPGHHKCRWCAMVFPFKYLLKNHIPSAHQDLYKFKCEICSKTYTSDRSLILHKEVAHSDGSLSFPCEFCGKEFRHKHYAFSHYRFCPVKKSISKTESVPAKVNNSQESKVSTFVSETVISNSASK